MGKEVRKFIQVPDAPLKIYEFPDKELKYSIGIDTATGVGQDYTVMQVLSNTVPFEQVAMFRAKWSVVDAAKFANDLGHYYNQAMICVETNYPGNAVQDALIQTYRYPRNYQAEQHLDEAPNVSTKYGFQTTQASKWLLIREMQSALKSNEIVLHDRQTLEELGTYVYIEDKSKTGAAQGLNDDCVMGIMLAYHIAMMWPQKLKKPEKRTLSGDALQHKSLMDKFMKKLINEGINGKPVEIL